MELKTTQNRKNKKKLICFLSKIFLEVTLPKECSDNFLDQQLNFKVHKEHSEFF